MSAQLTLRRYDLDDADRVWTVHERAMRAAPIEFVDDAPNDRPLRHVRDHYLEAGGEFLVGLVDDTVVAIGGFQRDDASTCQLRHVRVDPAHQRRGYGTRLLSELEARARADGFREAMLWTNERLSAARRLYEGNGYEETARETHAESGHVVVRYRKSLESDQL
ncbi:GNAT family N-acetyltransferase [Haloterrigena sp. SYSU A558-1]|uniref:GNAT family N-acetyltransferase n=1 Tax=Haloterrigena gelatinilytica TaxID=2741724 RepID=A0ABX2LCS8_9EURY|nr:GNAT family N-acetyltransferase [Haloterrigena gelatinilytica]NUC72168.1 GNAT family N-acetyltransferase [Haloterrigena gelatinilytica]